MVVVRAWEERGMGSCSLMDIEFQFYKMKSSGDWLHNNVNLLDTTELYA